MTDPFIAVCRSDTGAWSAYNEHGKRLRCVVSSRPTCITVLPPPRCALTRAWARLRALCARLV